MSDLDEPSPTTATVLISNRQTASVDEVAMAGLARATLAGEGLLDVELSVSFVEESEIEDLHVRYMDEPGPTDVLSFPMDEMRPPKDGEEPPVGMLGDIVLCPAVTAAQAAASNRTPEDEADYLLIHGLLHLLGHDHAEPDEKKVMFDLNDRIIAGWQASRP